MRVLISVDAGHSAEYALREAQTFLKNFPSATIEVFTVIDMSLIVTGGQETDQTMIMNELQQQANSILPIASQALGPNTFTFSTETGYPVDEILRKIQSFKADLLIMGTHGRTGFDHLLIGSVAEKVLRHCECNTLIISMKKIGGEKEGH